MQRSSPRIAAFAPPVAMSGAIPLRQTRLRSKRRAASGGGAQAQAGGGSFEQYLAAEADEAGRAAAGAGADLAGLLDQPLLLDETAEILLVQPRPGQCLDRALQLQERKGGRHQLEHHWTVFDLAAQPAD